MCWTYQLGYNYHGAYDTRVAEEFDGTFSAKIVSQNVLRQEIKGATP